MVTPTQDTTDYRCTLCKDPAWARFYMDAGCVALPDVHDQYLCANHICKAQPRGGMVLVEDLTRDGLDKVMPHRFGKV